MEGSVPPSAENAPSHFDATLNAVLSGRTVLLCDSPHVAETQQVSQRLHVRGWAFSRSGIASVEVRVGSLPASQADYGLARPDLILVFESLQTGDSGLPPSQLREAGYSADIELTGMPRGITPFTVSARARDGGTASVSGEIHITDEAADTPDGPTGERYVPEAHAGMLIEVEHQARYHWAAAGCRDRSTLDIACGVGWGSEILAREGALAVIGADVSEEAIAAAKSRGTTGVRFVLENLECLSFQDGSFDAVTCFETIEHLADPERGLDEILRVLRPEGVVLISSPNRGVYPAGNPYHIHEYTAAELIASLKTRFSSVAVYRQNQYVSSLISCDTAAALKDPRLELRAGTRKVAGHTPGDEVYTVCIAGNGALPQMPDLSMLGAPIDPTRWYEAGGLTAADAESLRQELEHYKALAARTIVQRDEARRTRG